MAVIHHPGPPLVIGHRGTPLERPENTLPSFQRAIELGVDAVEFDVRVSADGVAVVHHDATTGRTCGDDLLVERTTIGALRRLDAATMFAGPYTPAHQTVIPLLDEVLAMTRGLPIIIECKTVEAVPLVLAALASHGAEDRAIIGSFLHRAMQMVRAAGVSSGASRRDMVGLTLRGLARLSPGRMPFAAMCVPEQSSGITLPLERLARWGRALDVPVHVWTVNDAASATRFWDMGVTGVMTDDAATILAARATRTPR